jgi:hypothetical protein
VACVQSAGDLLVLPYTNIFEYLQVRAMDIADREAAGVLEVIAMHTAAAGCSAGWRACCADCADWCRFAAGAARAARRVFHWPSHSCLHHYCLALQCCTLGWGGAICPALSRGSRWRAALAACRRCVW